VLLIILHTAQSIGVWLHVQILSAPLPGQGTTLLPPAEGKFTPGFLFMHRVPCELLIFA